MEKNSKIYNNPLIGKNKQFLQEIMDKISAESEKKRIKKVAIWVENADIAYRHIYCNRSNCMGWISV